MKSEPDIDTEVIPFHVESADNGAAVKTIAADPEHCWVLRRLDWSYKGDPAAGSYLKVEVGGETIHKQFIKSGGPGFCRLRKLHNNGAKNEAMVITLVAGGSGVIGTINGQYQ